MNKKEQPHAITLLEESFSQGTLKEEELLQFQTELAELLRLQIQAYTEGESSSIKTEVAQNLLQSILYIVDLSLSSEEGTNAKMALICKGTPLSALYERGMALYQKRKVRAKELLQEVKETKLNIPIRAYTLTIEEGFEHFFRHMEAPLFAQEAEIDIDYPLLQDAADETGLLYVETYLSRLRMENFFCSIFPTDTVERLILGWAKKYHLSPADLMSNLTEMILRNAIFCILAGRSPKELLLSATDCEFIEKRLAILPEAELPLLLHKAMEHLLTTVISEEPTAFYAAGGDIYRGDFSLAEYLNSFIDVFLPSLISSLKNRSLAGQLWITEPTVDTEELFFIDGQALPDEDLRQLIDDLKESENSERKTELLFSSIKSLADAMVIFDEGIFFSEEYPEVFSRLSTTELGLLAAPLIDPAPFSEMKELSLSHTAFPEARELWLSHLLDFVEKSPSALQNEITEKARSYSKLENRIDSFDFPFYNEL